MAKPRWDRYEEDYRQATRGSGVRMYPRPKDACIRSLELACEYLSRAKGDLADLFRGADPIPVYKDVEKARMMVADALATLKVLP